MPKISVIIPCYNSAKYISKCLDALEKQTYKDFEILIVNDASTDNSLKLLLHEKDTRNLSISIIEHKINKGPGVARNSGIAKANGEFLAFCDCDDWYDEDFLEMMIVSAEKHNADIVMCNSKLVMSGGFVKDNSYTEIFKKNSTKKEYLAYSRTALCYLLVKKNLFNELKLPSLYNGEDMAIVPLLILRANKVIHINNALYNYAVRSNSASNIVSRNVYESMLEVYRILKSNWGEEYLDELEFIEIKTVLYAATLTGIKAGVKNKELENEIVKFYKEFPKWKKNKYIKNMPNRHRFFIWFSGRKLLNVNRIYVKIHTFLLNR